MNNSSKAIWAAAAILILIGAAVLINRSRDSGASVDNSTNGVSTSTIVAPASIKSFTVQRPNFIIGGDNLSRVEVWNNSGQTPVLIGTATKKSGQGEGEIWTLVIPANLAKTAKVYALGFDRNGTPVANMTLPSGQL